MGADRHKRLRVFAGPNGSGKSTIKDVVLDYAHLGVYVNADELKVILQKDRRLKLSDYNVVLNKESFINEFRTSSLTSKINNIDATVSNISFEDNQIILKDSYVIEDYFVSFITSYIWNNLLKNSNKFTVETVMSHPSKLHFMRKAKEAGFKVYLYFVSLADPELNKHRVRARVALGGHPVDEKKIVQRYYRTMGNLYEAIKIADTAYFFDNSAGEPKLFAIKEKGFLKIMSEYIPKWFDIYVLDVMKKSKPE